MIKSDFKKILIFGLSNFSKYFSPFIDIFEKHYKRITFNSDFQPVFIVGPPRSGSTILYQSITNRFEVSYIDNLTCMFYRNLLFGNRMSNLIYNACPHNTSKSNFGNTSEYGFHAPSECGEFWYQWLPRDKHFIDYSDFDEKVVNQIQKEIFSIIQFEKKPFVFKNLNAGQRLRLISRVAPKAKIIFIKRKTLDNALSIYQSRLKNGIKEDEWWSIMPPNVSELNRLPLYEKIVKQIYYIEKQIMDDKYLFPSKNFLKIQYEDYLDNPNNHLDIIKDFIGSDIKERNDKKALSVKKKNHTYNKKVVEGLKAEIEKIDWNFH